MSERDPFVEQALNELYEDAEKKGKAPVFTVGGKAWNEYDELTCPYCGKIAHPEICEEERMTFQDD